MKVTFFFNTLASAETGTEFREALIKAYSKRLLEMAEKKLLDPKVFDEIEKQGELKVFISDFDIKEIVSEDKEKSIKKIAFSHFTQPPVFNKMRSLLAENANNPLGQELYYWMDYKGVYSQGCVTLNPINSEDEYCCPALLSDNQEDIFEIRYKTIIDFSLPQKMKLQKLVEDSSSSLSRKRFPYELSQEVDKYLSQTKITHTSVMMAFEEEIEKEAERLEKEGNTHDALWIRAAKERALLAAKKDKELAHSFFLLCNFEKDNKESVKTIAETQMKNTTREHLRPTKIPASTTWWNGLFGREADRERSYRAISKSEENLLLAGEKINARNTLRGPKGNC